MVSHNNKPYIDIDNNRDIDTMSAFIDYRNKRLSSFNSRKGVKNERKSRLSGKLKTA